jgi:hypothetical protein
MQTARATGFQTRKSKLKPVEFLDSVLFDNVGKDAVSLQQHCFSIHKNYDKSISKQGLSKRFNESSIDFMKALLEKAMQSQIKRPVLLSKYQSMFKTIRIMDSTEFKLPEKFYTTFPGFNDDGTYSCAQVQFEYDLFSGTIQNLSLNGAIKSDRTVAHEIMSSQPESSLIIRDLGYYNLSVYNELRKRSLLFISRLHPQIKIYQKEDAHYIELTHKKIEHLLKRNKGNYLDIQVYIGKEAKIPVRLTANLVSKETSERRITKYKKKMRTIDKDELLQSKLNLFVTNVECDKCTADEIYKLYKIRWQVELIFKTWKSIVRIDKIGKLNEPRLICYLLGKLLWILLCWDMYRYHNNVLWHGNRKLISVYKFYALIKLEVENLRILFLSVDFKIQHWYTRYCERITLYATKENKKGRVPIEKLMNLI